MSLKALAGMYQRSVGKCLSRYGLRYEDVLVETPEVVRAVTWLDQSEQLARERRLVRATDLSFKRNYLPESLQSIQEPLNLYLEENLHEAEALKEERDELTRW